MMCAAVFQSVGCFIWGPLSDYIGKVRTLLFGGITGTISLGFIAALIMFEVNELWMWIVLAVFMGITDSCKLAQRIFLTLLATETQVYSAIGTFWPQQAVGYSA